MHFYIGGGTTFCRNSVILNMSYIATSKRISEYVLKCRLFERLFFLISPNLAVGDNLERHINLATCYTLTPYVKIA